MAAEMGHQARPPRVNLLAIRAYHHSHGASGLHAQASFSSQLGLPCCEMYLELYISVNAGLQSAAKLDIFAADAIQKLESYDVYE